MYEYKRNDGLSLAYNIFKWVFIIAYVGITAFMAFSMVDSYQSDLTCNEGCIKGFPIVLALVVVAYGMILYGALFVVGIISSIINCVRKNKGTIDSNKVAWIYIFLPILTYGLLVIIGVMVNNSVS